MSGRTLVIETATAACSVALIADGRVMDQRHEEVGRGHAERLLPMIAELAGGGRAHRILVDVGPGSFTGVRVGLAAALGLGLGWEAEVTGFSSTFLIAAAAVRDTPASLAVVLEGGHGELFVQTFTPSPFAAAGALASLTPVDTLAAIGELPAIGSGVRWLGRDHAGDRAALPRAADAILLDPAHAALPPHPIYGRAPDAKPVRSAAEGATPPR